MSNTLSNQAQISIDCKKSRVRIYKDALRKIGNPRYIQLLVSVKTPQVAIRGLDYSLPEDNAHRVNQIQMYSDTSIEIYSSIFIEKLRGCFSGFDDRVTYRLSGSVYAEKRMIVFPVSNLHAVNTAGESNE